MPSIKALFLASLSCLGHRFNLNNVNQPTNDITSWNLLPATQTQIQVPEDFKSGLSHIPKETLHAVLHRHLPHFKDGVFEGDHRAVEEIYKRNPEMANQLVAAARYDVLRRQNGNLTTTSRPPATTPTTTRPITITQTQPDGSVILSTFTPVGGVYTSQVIQTSTMQDGSRSTYTSFTVVPAPTQAGGSSPDPKLTGDATAISVGRPVTLVGVLMLAMSFAGFALL